MGRYKTKKLASMSPEESFGSDVSHSATGAILVADVVDSVRLMEQHESDTIQRWRHIFDRSRTAAIGANGGRVVKHTGDGAIAVFPTCAGAALAAFAIHSYAVEGNAGRVEASALRLRIGIHFGSMIEDDLDIYGSNVNLAARLMALAGPGETVVSPAVRDELADDIDADIEDLGNCYLKNIAQPVRAYRAGPIGPRPLVDNNGGQALDLRPAIAVIPPLSRIADPAHAVVGEAIADELIAALSCTTGLHVISRLSTSVLRGRQLSGGEIGAYLGAQYILSGSYFEVGPGLRIFLELTDARSGGVIWAESASTTLGELFSSRNEFIVDLAATIATSISSCELRRSFKQPLPNLESYALFMGAVGLMHRLDHAGFERSRVLLEALIARLPRQALPHAWMAKWHVLRVQQGWATDATDDAMRALDHSKRALDLENDCSMALAIDGLVHTNLLKQFDVAEDRYRLALNVNPNDSLALLLLGTLQAFQGRGSDAVGNTEAAMRLSPLDPLKYFYDSLAATAALSNRQFDRAIELAQRSLKANRTHTSTLRALTIAQALSGDLAAARATAAELRRVEPNLTVAGYLRRNPSGMFETGRSWGDALKQAGIPES